MDASGAAQYHVGDFIESFRGALNVQVVRRTVRLEARCGATIAEPRASCMCRSNVNATGRADAFCSSSGVTFGRRRAMIHDGDPARQTGGLSQVIEVVNKHTGEPVRTRRRGSCPTLWSAAGI